MKKWIKNILLIGLLCLLISKPVYAEVKERSLYIGDIIELEIDNTFCTMEDVEEALKDYEVISIEENDGKYLVRFRTFQTGEQHIYIKNQEIVISVASTLEDLGFEQIIDSNAEVIKADLIIPWNMILVFLILICVGAISYGAVILIKNRKKKPLTVKEVFLNKVNGLSLEEEDFIKELSLAFRDYFSVLTNKTITYMTSKEIARLFNTMGYENGFIIKIENWMHSCDSYNYSIDKATDDIKSQMRVQLLEIINSVVEEGVDSVDAVC